MNVSQLLCFRSLKALGRKPNLDDAPYQMAFEISARELHDLGLIKMKPPRWPQYVDGNPSGRSSHFIVPILISLTLKILASLLRVTSLASLSLSS